MLVAVHPVFGMAGAASRGIGEMPARGLGDACVDALSSLGVPGATCTVNADGTPNINYPSAASGSTASVSATASGPLLCSKNAAAGFNFDASGNVVWTDSAGVPLCSTTGGSESGSPATGATSGLNIGMIALAASALLVLGVFVSAK